MRVRVSGHSEGSRDGPCARGLSGPPQMRPPAPHLWALRFSSLRRLPACLGIGSCCWLRRHGRDLGSSHRVCWPAWVVCLPPLRQRAETPRSEGDEGWGPLGKGVPRGAVLAAVRGSSEARRG